MELLIMKKGKNAYLFVIVLILGTLLLTSACSGKTPTATETPISHVHSYEKLTITPSCTEAGFCVYTCSCGDSYEDDPVPALGHSYDATVIAPTYTSQGYTEYVCSTCTDRYQDMFTNMPSDVFSSLATPDYLLPLEIFSRERKENPEFVMIHFISAVVISREDPYNKDTVRSIFTDYEISVHYIIDRDGTVTCYIPEDRVAYHAGSGTWEDDPKYTNFMNDYAIGIEVMAIGSQDDMAQYLSADAYNALAPEHIGFTDAQYEALKALVQDICARNGIPMDRSHIIGHEEYSPAKTDPGALFDWSRLFA